MDMALERPRPLFRTPNATTTVVGDVRNGRKRTIMIRIRPVHRVVQAIRAARQTRLRQPRMVTMDAYPIRRSRQPPMVRFDAELGVGNTQVCLNWGLLTHCTGSSYLTSTTVWKIPPWTGRPIERER